MNARTNPTISQPTEVTGELLYTGYDLTDTLQVDLYGCEADEDGDIEVVGVALTGDVNRTDITELFSGHQLMAMGKWIQFKDDTRPAMREAADRARYDIARLPI